MFTNQRLLTVFLILFIVGGAIFFVYTKFKQEVGQATATPSPTPQNLEFIFNEQVLSNRNKTPAPAQSNPQSTERPLVKNKRLAQFPGLLTPEILQNKKAIIQTAKGIIQLQIYPEATMAASNFMLLAANGFYDGLTFHRVEDWVIQGGDPTGTGSGGPGYQFPDEPVDRPYVKGVVAMANSGPNTNGSQFFILKTDYPLDPKYTIFGQVIAGQEVVDQITVGDIMQTVIIQNL